MPRIKIGIQTRSLRLPLRQAIAAAAELGADGVEIDLRNELPLADLSQTALRQFRKLLDDHGLRLAAASYPTQRGYDDLDELERRLQGTRRALRAAADLGSRVLLGRIAKELPTADDQQRRRVLIEALTSLAMEGTRVGARFAAITTPAPAAELAAILQKLPTGTAGVSLHPGNLLAGGQTPVEALEPLGPLVLHVHAVDAVRDFGSGRHDEVELGRGEADLPAIVATLEAHGYRGWYTVARSHADDPLAELGNAVAYLRSLEE